MSSAVALRIDGRVKDLGGFEVRRVLPAVERRRVGPFVFFDHMGPADLAPGAAFDVRPHPHIALATVTFLFDGEIFHRDSLGSAQAIRPGDVNWMVAGRGIVHSERLRDEVRAAGQRLHGIQCWMALPIEHEETEPRFAHHPASTLPRVTREGATLDVIAGTGFGATSPVEVLSPTLYVHGQLDAGASLALDTEHEERAVYVVAGDVVCNGAALSPGTLAVLQPGANVTLAANAASRIMLLGGAPLAGERHLWWNFVSSSEARLERAKADWAADRFPKVPGDEVERIPLPTS